MDGMAHSVVSRKAKRAPLSAPISINLELTSGCNIQCRHCYNFWREDPASFKDSVSMEKIDRLVAMIVASKVFHVILTGGEPLLNFPVMEYAARRLSEAGLSISTNSNLMLATPTKMERLRVAGLDHILTSLNSYDPATNDHMMNKPGALDRIKEGIRTTRAAGIRVSANMVISTPNAEHVYETARLAAALGVQKIFATRLVPSVTVEDPHGTILELDIAGARRAVEDLARAKRDFGIDVGTLISYPLCFLGDLATYADFVGRGCPAQTGNRMVLNANGDSHACTHEEENYGNVFEVGLTEAFGRMSRWHDGSYRYQGCAGCAYQEICGSGCRMAANSYYKRRDAQDPLFVGFDRIGVPYTLDIPAEIVQTVDRKAQVVVPPRIRFRQEDGYCLLNVRWANAFAVPTELAVFLREQQAAGTPFDMDDLPGLEGRRHLLYLLFKDAVEPVDDAVRTLLLERPRMGASVNPFDLPDSALRV
ncbi:radical SAM/SPASM domain-containing protein [Azospirillum tabaci]|uniref:radical SAM/SPASM domain-containing protein n=1 Tax=Azospirillum tabaci TaxID=2752310 RepID=UPI001B3B4D5C|nr:radical SAM protein [Azospirillum tabaci]